MKQKYIVPLQWFHFNYRDQENYAKRYQQTQTKKRLTSRNQKSGSFCSTPSVSNKVTKRKKCLDRPKDMDEEKVENILSEIIL